MSVQLCNPEQIPEDLPPGTYCCRIDESSSLNAIKVRFVTPPRVHEPGDCLVQVTKAAGGAAEIDRRIQNAPTDALDADAAMLEAMDGGGWTALRGIPYEDAMDAHERLRRQ